MLTAMQTKASETTTNTQLFPLEVNCEQQSLIYIKRLTAVAISNILYLRNVFNEDCYGHRKLDSIKLRILTEKSPTAGAQQIVQWVKGCFDAMEKKYLKQLTLGILTDCLKPEELMEAYTFRFSYDNSSTNLNVEFNEKSVNERYDNTCQDLQRATTHLLRSLIILTQSLDKLPNDCYLTMKLLYYDEITPTDYEPPGFVSSDTDSFTFKGKPISINAGEVVTPHHSLRLKIRTDNSQFEDFVPTQDSQIDSQDRDQCSPNKTDYQQNQSSKNHFRMTDTSNAKQSDVRPRMSTSTPNRSDYDLVRNRPEEELNESLRSNIERDFARPKQVTNVKKSAQKAGEKSVRTRIQDLRVDDDEETYERNANKRKVTVLEPMDFEVTQDSTFDSNTRAQKKLKASKTDKTIPISGQRIRL